MSHPNWIIKISLMKKLFIKVETVSGNQHGIVYILGLAIVDSTKSRGFGG